MERGFFDGFEAHRGRFRTALGEVLDRPGVAAGFAGRQSFWQVLFADRDPIDEMDVLASDSKRPKALDLALLANGVYVLPNVWRFFSAAHDDRELEDTLEVLDAACDAVA